MTTTQPSLVITPASVELMSASSRGVVLQLTPPEGGSTGAVCVRFPPETFAVLLQGLATALVVEDVPLATEPEDSPESPVILPGDAAIERWLSGHDDHLISEPDDVLSPPNIYHVDFAQWPKVTD